MTEVRKRGAHETQFIFQAGRLINDLERVSKDPRKILAADLENSQTLYEAAERQEKAKALANRDHLAETIRCFTSALEKAVEDLPENSFQERMDALAKVSNFRKDMAAVSACIPFANEPSICVQFQDEASSCPQE